MKQSRFSEEQIFAILRETDAGDSAKEVCRRHGISPATFYQWKAKYGGLARFNRTYREEVLDAYILFELDEVRNITRP